MTKCEEAQKGIDLFIDQLVELNTKALSGASLDEYLHEKIPLSIAIRQKLFTVVRMIIHYGKHLGGYKPVDGQPNYPEDLVRITYLEDKPEIDV